MAIAIRSGRRHTTQRPVRPLWVRPRTTEYETALPILMIVLLAVGISVLAVTAQWLEDAIPRSLAATFGPAPPTRPAHGAVPVTIAERAADTELSAATTAGQVSPATEPEMETATTPRAPAVERVQPALAHEPVAGRLAVGGRARVVNTDNMGVVFHSAPGPGTRQPAGLLEGTAVTVLELSGTDWARVQAGSKKSGWVRAAYLAPVE